MNIPSISGPSMLGLNQPATNQPDSGQPSMDLLREKSFSGLDSFFEPEQPKTGGRRFLLLLVLLTALGGAGWWIYTNYLNPTETQKPQVASSSPAAAPTDMSSTKPTATTAAPAPDAGSTQSAASSQAVAPATATPSPVPEGPSENANPPVAETKPEVRPVPKPSPAPATSARAASPKIPLEKKTVSKREAIAPAAQASPEPVATASGDADFRKGEAYLYGRGVPENCDEAVKYLKAASAESNAKARSAFGTMYATGHCVVRDLPTSYQWFAMALRLDPTNQILEKDLTAIWNQMTPPERQMAARAKQ